MFWKHNAKHVSGSYSFLLLWRESHARTEPEVRTIWLLVEERHYALLSIAMISSRCTFWKRSDTLYGDWIYIMKSREEKRDAKGRLGTFARELP